MTFQDIALKVSNAAGSAWAFLLAVGSIVVWAALGPLFDYSEGWQLAINSSTTIITFLMVFMIQSTQNRDTRVMQLKIDELIRAVHGARTELIRAGELPDEAIEKVEQELKSEAVS